MTFAVDWALNNNYLSTPMRCRRLCLLWPTIGRRFTRRKTGLTNKRKEKNIVRALWLTSSSLIRQSVRHTSLFVFVSLRLTILVVPYCQLEMEEWNPGLRFHILEKVIVCFTILNSGIFGAFVSGVCWERPRVFLTIAGVCMSNCVCVSNCVSVSAWNCFVWMRFSAIIINTVIIIVSLLILLILRTLFLLQLCTRVTISGYNEHGR